MKTKRRDASSLVGKVVPWKRGPVRVMAVAEGHVMVRRKGCVPFTITLAELRAEAKKIAGDLSWLWLADREEK